MTVVYPSTVGSPVWDRWDGIGDEKGCRGGGWFGIRGLKKREKQGMKTDKTLIQHSFVFDCFTMLTQLENYYGNFFPPYGNKEVRIKMSPEKTTQWKCFRNSVSVETREKVKCDK